MKLNTAVAVVGVEAGAERNARSDKSIFLVRSASRRAVGVPSDSGLLLG